MRQLPLRSGFFAACRSIGYGGDAIRLFVRDEVLKQVFARVQSPGFASFPVSRTVGTYSALVEVTNAYGSYEVELRELSTTFSLIQLLPGERILVVSSRCLRFNDGTHELNAGIYDSNGALQSEFLLGDGIQHVQTDKSGNIWVGYFDEGVYGNFGWGGTGNAAPVGAAGLVCFNSEGKKVWEYQSVPGTDVISDVYALNVFGDEAWAYYYTDFPLIRIKGDRRIQAWTTKTSGARAFAVGHTRVLLFGGYRDDSDSCRLLRLTDTEATLEANASLLLTEGGNIREATVIGRGHILHVLADDIWYQYSTAPLP